uniref:Retrovirus-related Pol polyprotein from transposon TNT 1-94 n=1 Tax=Cajanus cajan TaxID=3821 RepID=A0A151SQ31_CAJCA|nr:Retrovirus-related Pol polyprotein from transposon TNT 1-94 [Cajanus cajan]
MHEEIQALESNNTWSLISLPAGHHCIGCRWVYKLKHKPGGIVDKYKIRLVAKGYTQQAGIDFSDTFSPVAKLTSIRVLLAVVATKNWCLQQLDVNNVFLNGDLFEEVYMDLPQGYKPPTHGLVSKLNKSFYGLRQASRQWFCKFSNTLLHHGFTQSKNDYSLFTYGSGSSLVILLVYVDDINLAGPKSDCVNKVQQQLQSLFKLKILGPLKYFLGLEIAKSNKRISLSWRKYTLSLLDDIGFLGCKPLSIPMDPNLKLTLHDGKTLLDPSMYRRLIGRLMYLTISRPDITFAVHKLSQYMQKPMTTHLNAVHHLLQYLKSNPGQGLFFPAANTLHFSAYADADWGSCLDTRKSTIGFCVFLGNALLSWKSVKQGTVSKSSSKSEYRALSSVASEIVWLKCLLTHFEIFIDSAMLFCDNKSAIHLASNPSHHERSKHIDIDCHFIRELVQSASSSLFMSEHNTKQLISSPKLFLFMFFLTSFASWVLLIYTLQLEEGYYN